MATTGGRGTSSIVRRGDDVWVVRHYRRGGFVGKVLNDQYAGFSREMSRSWREWRLLHRLHGEGYPVPRPVAAAVHFSCGFYRADLVTRFVPGTVTLAQALGAGELASQAWEAVGRCIARFHRRGVCHADLNAHNILVDRDRHIFLIDFDRGRIRGAGGWQEANLRRLLRSLHKIRTHSENFHFTRDGWQALLDGYAGG